MKRIISAALAALVLIAPMVVAAAPVVPVVQVGNNGACQTTVPSNYAVNISTATTAQAVAVSGTTAIAVCKVFVFAGGTTNVTLEYGTGSNCSGGTTALTGPIPLTAQAGWLEQAGVIAPYTVPAGNGLCIVNSAGVQVSGSILYVQQ